MATIQRRRLHGPRALRIVGYVLVGLGLVGLAVAGGWVAFELRGERSASAEGVIIGFDYGPIVEFTTKDGTKSRFSSSVRSTFWHRGDQVPVAYAPKDPSDAMIDGFAGRWLVPGLLGILGGLFFVAGLALDLAGLFLGRAQERPLEAEAEDVVHIPVCIQYSENFGRAVLSGDTERYVVRAAADLFQIGFCWGRGFGDRKLQTLDHVHRHITLSLACAQSLGRPRAGQAASP